MPQSRRCARARGGTVVGDRGPGDGLAQDAARLERVHRQVSVEMRRHVTGENRPLGSTARWFGFAATHGGVWELTTQATTIAWSTRAAAPPRVWQIVQRLDAARLRR